MNMYENISKKLKKKLLVISCSKAKKDLVNKPAIEIYDGPSFRILRKSYLTDKDILIISAKYGIINSDFLISTYEQRMTPHRAKELSYEISNRIDVALSSGLYNEVFFELGKDYLDSVKIDPSKYQHLKIKFDSGSIGVRLHNLKAWLDEGKNLSNTNGNRNV